MPCTQKCLSPHLGDLLLVVHHQQRHREQDGPEALHALLEAARRGQLVALLQAGDEVRETQAHGGETLLGPAVLVGNKQKERPDAKNRGSIGVVVVLMLQCVKWL